MQCSFNWDPRVRWMARAVAAMSCGVALTVNTLAQAHLFMHVHLMSFCTTDLCSVSATCLLWSKLTKDKASNNVWKRFYTSRWRVTGAAGEDICWQSKYGSKMKQVG